MFTRSISTLAGMLIVAGALAVAPAMATDDPAPSAQANTAPSAQANTLTCVDNQRPLSRLSVGWQRGFRKGVVRGIAIDQGCGVAGAGKVKLVSVSIARKVGKRCQHLMPNGRLGRAIACTHVWLPAKGAKAWIFRLRHRLPRGTYIVSTRAVDSAGNVEGRAQRQAGDNQAGDRGGDDQAGDR
jgi:hypothetical protein